CNLKFKTFLLEEGIIDEAWLEKIETEHKEIVNQATKEAEKAPYPSPEETYAHVYEEGSSINA
ncbi:thiamine pyrophosphate-dependent dehydrogenase E1 component subunit alpha, partial [Staphylococcus saprophyticus]|uniref:thiamine pyrophosphate-dependent enzyme n=1 Tax=Staphylococcus saprophyticus TaxID=29385 RepID=UPI001EC8A861